MYFITTKRMLEVCFSAHPNIQYRTLIYCIFNNKPLLKHESENGWCFLCVRKPGPSMCLGMEIRLRRMIGNKI